MGLKISKFWQYLWERRILGKGKWLYRRTLKCVPNW